MGKDSFTFPLVSSSGCRTGTILPYCAPLERSGGSASVAPLIWTSPCRAKNPCCITTSNFYHQRGCCFSSVKVSFPLFFKICPCSALREVYFSTFLPNQKKKRQTKKTPTKQKSKWDFLDCSVLEIICGHKWVNLMFLKGEGGSRGGSELNGKKNKWPNLEMRPKCGCGGLVLFFSLVTFNDKRLLILKRFLFFLKNYNLFGNFLCSFQEMFFKIKILW